MHQSQTNIYMHISDYCTKSPVDLATALAIIYKCYATYTDNNM